jgi:hypothetical protein
MNGNSRRRSKWLGAARRTTSGVPRRVPALDRDKITRLSYLLGIYKVAILFPTTEDAALWIQRPNDAPLFPYRSAGCISPGK